MFLVLELQERREKIPNNLLLSIGNLSPAVELR